jgi:hypothetical protein
MLASRIHRCKLAGKSMTAARDDLAKSEAILVAQSK